MICEKQNKGCLHESELSYLKRLQEDKSLKNKMKVTV